MPPVATGLSLAAGVIVLRYLPHRLGTGAAAPAEATEIDLDEELVVLELEEQGSDPELA